MDDNLYTVTGRQLAEVSIRSPVLQGSIAICTAAGKALVTIKPDGVIEYGEDYSPDAAAKIFWEAIGFYHPSRLERAVPDMYAALMPFADIDGEDDEHFTDDAKVITSFGRSTNYTLTLGDFRRARMAFARATA